VLLGSKRGYALKAGSGKDQKRWKTGTAIGWGGAQACWRPG
jgi:hypothetical protein